MSLSYYYALLRLKQEQLVRLQNCNSELQGNKQEFSNFKPSITMPDLTAQTWFGMLASEFDDIRFDGMLNSYSEIEGNQFSNIFAALIAKIQQIQQEIIAIQQTIAALEAAARERDN